MSITHNAIFHQGKQVVFSPKYLVGESLYANMIVRGTLVEIDKCHCNCMFS